MSQWITRISQHPIWGALEATDISISAALERDSIGADVIDSLERLRTVVKYAKVRISAADPALVPVSAMNNSVQPLNQMKSYVENFSSSGDVNQISSANNSADTFLTNLNLIQGAVIVDDLSAISEAATNYRQTLEKYLEGAQALQNSLFEKAGKNEVRIKSIEDSLTKEQQRLAALASEQQSQFSAAQDKRASEFATAQADYLAKYTSVSTEQKTQFSTDQDLRKTAFSDLQRESQEKLVVLMSDYDQKLKDHNAVFQAKEKLASDEHEVNLQKLTAQYSDQASDILARIEKHKQEVESLVGVIGNLGVTSGYKKVANYARWMVIVWQSLTVASLAGLICVAFLVAFPGVFKLGTTADRFHQQSLVVGVGTETLQSLNPDKARTKEGQSDAKVSAEIATGAHTEALFFEGLATRIFLSITFGIFAAYAGKQASRFFEMEQKNRRLALELEALGPFIEPLEKADRDKFRVQIGDRSFGVPDYEKTSPKEDDPVTLAGWLKSKDGIAAITDPIRDILKGWTR
jgi:hypothetical protein